MRVFWIIWQLPQWLLGWVLIKLTRATSSVHKDVYFFSASRNYWTSIFSGVSLGSWILLPSNAMETTVKHEMGHQVQSRLLGWLYLPVVGLYSIYSNIYDRVKHKDWCTYDRQYWYYKTRWTEKWADKLGNVDRDRDLAQLIKPIETIYPQVVIEDNVGGTV